MSGIVARASYRFGACGRPRGTGTSSRTGRLRCSRAPPSRVPHCGGSAPSLRSRRCLHPPAHALAVRRRRAETAAARRKRRLVGLLLLAAVALITLLLTAFGSRGSAPITATAPAPATRLLPSGPPQPQVVAMNGALRLELPIAQNRVTAIAYHASGDGALALDPVGHQGNQGIVSRVAHKLFGGGQTGLRYYVLEGGTGPQTAALDVGRRSGNRRLLARGRDDRRDHALRPRRQGLRLADRHPAERRPVARRLAHAPAPRPEPDGRLVGRLDHLEDRHGPQLHRRRGPGARPLHAGRRATTSPSRSTPPPRSR